MSFGQMQISAYLEVQSRYPKADLALSIHVEQSQSLLPKQTHMSQKRLKTPRTFYG
jgi:hypothetical protein